MPAYVLLPFTQAQQKAVLGYVPFKLTDTRAVKTAIVDWLNPAQQIFLNRTQWTFRRESAGLYKKPTDLVRVRFTEYFADSDATQFHLLFSEYKKFNHEPSKVTVDAL